MDSLLPRRPVVLVVDDELEVLEEVAVVLQSRGFECYCCSTPEAALAAAELHPPELIVSDINLGGHSGLQLCQQIRDLSSAHDLPVMFLSGAQIPDIIRRSHAAGGTYYLRKPFDPDVLVELVDKALWMPHLVARRESAASVSAS